VLNYEIEKKINVKKNKKRSMSIRVNISYLWPRSWDRDHHTEKKYKTQFLINLMLKDKIKKKSILKNI
jgi:hypothetical protein